MVTMADVARVANVSATTVSHVLNKTRKVQPETAQAVLAAIEATGYSGDGIARSLRTGMTETIGLAMSAISNPYFGDLVHAIESNVTTAGYSLLLADTHDDPVREKRAVNDLLSHRVDAMIVAPSADPATMLDTLAKRGIPTVLIDRVPAQTRNGVDAIGVVNDEPNARLVDHFARIGHTRIATITSSPHLVTTAERLDGYWSGIKRNGLPTDRDLVQVGEPGSEQAMQRAMTALLGLSNPATAIIMGNNQVTIGAMRALRERGLEVPRDIAIACFDDFAWADLFHPRLTAISQPVDQLGSQAVSMLLERLHDRHLAPRHRRLQPTIQHRESCGCTSPELPL